MAKKWITHLSFPTLPPPLYADYRQLVETYKVHPYDMLKLTLQCALHLARTDPQRVQEIADKLRG